jgi:hypothetical protein
MSKILQVYRWKGHSVSKSVYDAKLRGRELGQANHVESQSDENTNFEKVVNDSVAEQREKPILEGRRIVEVSLFGDELWCVLCKKCLSLQHVEREIRRGFGSFLVLSIKCHKCLLLNEVEIGKTQCPDGKRIATRFDINYKAAIGKRYIFF